MDSQCSMISHDCAPPAAQALAPSLPSCFGGRDFSSQATLCWWAPSFPASGSGGSPCLRAWPWWQRLCSREDHSLSQGAFAVGSTELPASAVRCCWGIRETVCVFEGPVFGIKKPFYVFGWYLVNVLLSTRESLSWHRPPAAFITSSILSCLLQASSSVAMRLVVQQKTHSMNY